MSLGKSIKVHKIQLAEVKRDGPGSLEWLFMKSHEFAKLINSNYYRHLAKKFPPFNLPSLFVDTATFYTVSLLPLQIFGIFSAWLTGINHFIRKQIVSRSKGDLLAFFILLYICELVAITGHGLIILASKSFFCLYLHYQSFYTFLYRCKHPIFEKNFSFKVQSTWDGD